MEADSQLAGAFAAIIKPIVVEAVREALDGCRGEKAEDRMLTVDQAAEILSVSRDWLYAHGEKLGLRRKLGPKAVRYSARAVQKYLATKAS